MKYSSILKIENNNNMVLVAHNAIQELYPLNKHELLRNISLQPIVFNDNNDTRYKCIIKTNDIPDINLLKTNTLYNIYSIIQFKCPGNSIPKIPYVSDSIQHNEDGTIFRPILQMYLIDFSIHCETSGNNKLMMEFVS
ncbi:MAG: hypothetical protein IJ848_02965 [Alphaproteobacteria bacterium]|nr:hypothetical protein [Alphaproteobacteria bacterium]